VLPLEGLSLDVDDASDLRALLIEASATESALLVSSWPVAERLRASVVTPAPSERRETSAQGSMRGAVPPSFDKSGARPPRR
jgi:hypothetical protein